jgi:nucleoside-diphosphate-sugar epimerase
MKRVLLTGASGFIGRHSLAPLLAHQYEVHAVSSRPQPDNGSAVRWHQADLLDSNELAALLISVRPTHLLHLAWYAEPGKYWTSEKNLEWVSASLNLLTEFVRQGGQRIVIAGTCAEYDWRYGQCSEDVTPLSPATLYGNSKHALQILLAALARQTSLSAAWGRIFFLFGPHEHPSRLVASVTRSLLKGEPALATSGEQIRDYLHVQDVAEAFVALLDSAVTGPVNIASGQPVAVRDINLTLAKLCQRPDLLRLGVLPTRPDDPPKLTADIRRLHNEVGWRPAYTLEQGLEHTVNWWAERLAPTTSRELVS